MYIVSIIQLHCLIHKSQSRVQGGWRIPPRMERELYDDGNDRGAGWKNSGAFKTAGKWKVKGKVTLCIFHMEDNR